MNIQQVEQRVLNVNIRVTPKEEKMLSLLAKYLHKRGLIRDETKSEALRYCLYFTFDYVRKTIELERYGGVKHE